MIGEQFDDANEVLGAVVSPRKGEIRIALWTRTAKDEDAQLRIGEFFKRNLSIGKEQQIQYSLHDESVKTRTSYRTGNTLTI